MKKKKKTQRKAHKKGKKGKKERTKKSKEKLQGFCWLMIYRRCSAKAMLNTTTVVIVVPW